MPPSAPLILDRKGFGAPPCWSVMTPTSNPRADYLEESLNSILQLDTGPEQMQIEVVDDGSADVLAPQTARRVDGGRVKFDAEADNRGLANIWNRRIERREVTGCIFSTRTTPFCPGFMSVCAKEPSRAMLARPFVDTRW